MPLPMRHIVKSTDWESLTPEERRQAIRKVRENHLRLELEDAGYTDLKMQDAVVNFVNPQEKVSAPLQIKLTKVTQLMRSVGALDALLQAQLTDLRAVVAMCFTLGSGNSLSQSTPRAPEQLDAQQSLLSANVPSLKRKEAGAWQAVWKPKEDWKPKANR